MTLPDPTKPALDLDALLDLVGGDAELFREVADLGATDLVRLLEALAGAATGPEMAQLAHELKGVLLNLTAAPAAAFAVEVERAARGGDANAARTAFTRARPVLDEVAVALLSASAGRGAAS